MDTLVRVWSESHQQLVVTGNSSLQFSEVISKTNNFQASLLAPYLENGTVLQRACVAQPEEKE